MTSQSHFIRIYQAKKLPKNIPTQSAEKYTKEGKWKGWNDFLGNIKTN